MAREIVEGLAKMHPAGPIFLNSEGRPWNKDSINCAIRRLRVTLGMQLMKPGDVEQVPRFRKWDVPKERLAGARREHRERLARRRKDIRKRAIELSKQYHLGALRKGFITEALKNGVEVVSLARLAGHRDPSMIARVYGQVQSDQEYMAEQALKAKTPRKVSNDDQPSMEAIAEKVAEARKAAGG
jgi:integrase/recombinase XerD